MMPARSLAWASCLIALPVSSAPEPGALSVSPPQFYVGTSDASAAVALTETLFAVGSDEDSVLRVYRNDRPGPPLEELNLTDALKVDPRFPETDLEGAARVGDRVYWITSHGRNQDGEDRSSRRRFFATDLKLEGERVRLEFVGTPCSQLVSELARDPRYAVFRLAEAGTRAPKAPGGLNIEGLGAAVDDGLLIGFRNPVSNGGALIAPLLNPAEVIQGHLARFGEPILLDLGGYGIRDLAMQQEGGVILAGAFDGKGKARLYFWDGVGRPPHLVEGLRLNRLNPEAVVLYPQSGRRRIQVLSDDSNRRSRQEAGNEGIPNAKKAFRSVWLEAR